jgi:magnesium-transporting ATPase (P-type)
MTSVYEKSDFYRVFIKGAPDFLMDKCTDYINETSEKSKMTGEFKERVLEKVVGPFAN